MGSRSETLAGKVDQANSALLAAIQASTDAQWSAKCADGDWSQGFSAFHAANSVGFITGMIQGMANGVEMPPITFEQIDAQNAEQHKEHAATCTKQQAIDAAKTNSSAATSMVRALTDEQLDRKVQLAVGLPEMNVGQVIDMLLVGHPTGHKDSIVNAR